MMDNSITLPANAMDRMFIPAKSDTGLPAKGQHVTGLHRDWIWFLIRMRIFFHACVILRRPNKIIRAFRALSSRRSNVWGGELQKLYRIDGKYYFNQYTPGWPSACYDALIKSELRRQTDPLNITEKLSFIFLAITRKCPMRCEHCFEWDNLNKKESFTKDDLFRVIDIYQKEGVLQFHFSGGEPMVRFKDLVELVRYTSPRSECWIATSGFNVTELNARKLKEAGCRGMVVSIDHYLPERHNRFRGNVTAFEQAVFAVEAARRAGLVTSVSVCATREFLDEGHLLPYIHFARDLGVQFIQVLEPKSMGHYEGKDVALEKRHIDLLEKAFTSINHAPEYAGFPTLLYHGYHQRRVGCFAGSRSVYVDSAGDVHACPFCHTKNYNIIDIIRAGQSVIPVKENLCPRFEKIA